MRATYYGMITQVDDQIGRLIAHLKETGEYDHTLIIFTCDHGEMLGDHWLWGKPGYFDEAYHIPLIIRDPRREADGGRGRIVGEFTEAIDLMPTILDWLGLELPASMRRLQLSAAVPVRASAPTGWRQEAHWEYDFSEIATLEAETALGLHSDQCTLERHPRQQVQVRAFHRAAAAVLRSGEGPRPVPTTWRRIQPMRAVCWNTRRRCCPGAWSMTSAR